jgi:hypothetical protein
MKNPEHVIAFDASSVMARNILRRAADRFGQTVQSRDHVATTRGLQPLVALHRANQVRAHWRALRHESHVEINLRQIAHRVVSLWT